MCLIMCRAVRVDVLLPLFNGDMHSRDADWDVRLLLLCVRLEGPSGVYGAHLAEPRGARRLLLTD